MREIVCDQLDNCSVVLLEYLNDPIDALVSNYEDAQVIRYDILGQLQFFISNFDYVREMKQLHSRNIRNLLFEIKYFRNEWAHGKDFTYRDVYRVADTIQLLFEEVGLAQNSSYFQRVTELRYICMSKMVETRQF
ncbi:hypothetical protein pb186bvf_002565 [Paramecium bursaria]